MPRTWYGRRKPEPPLEALTAAAVTVATNNPPSHVQWGGAGWQNEVWAHYDTTPELHQSAEVMGYAFSQAIMIAVDVDPVTLELGTDATDDPVATALVANLFGGPTGRAQAQKQMGQHLTTAGECWVLASDQDPDVDGQTWQILSVGEVTKAGRSIRIQQLDGTQRELLDTELLFRLFNPHPRRRWDADSPSLALMPVFRELAGLSAQILASIRSRLATGGLFLIPSSAAPPFTQNEKGEQVPFGVQGWMRQLADAMTTAIANPDDPSSLVPIVMTIPDDVREKIGDPIRFVQEIMTEVEPLRDAARTRIGIGMPMPPEMILGMGDVNHWGQWFISEQFVKGPLDSFLSLPADGFTSKYLRPGLTLAGKNPRLFAIRFKTDHMIVQANEENAKWAFSAGLLSRAATLEALHFDPARDAAPVAEQEKKLLEQMIARGNPQTVQELADMIRLLYPNFKLDTLEPLPTNGAPAISVSQPAPVAPKAINAPVTEPAPSTTATQSPPALPSGS